jgi:hypothetical protein
MVRHGSTLRQAQCRQAHQPLTNKFPKLECPNLPGFYIQIGKLLNPHSLVQNDKNPKT